MGLSDLTEERHRLSWAKEIGDRRVHWHAFGVTMGEMRGCSFLFVVVVVQVVQNHTWKLPRSPVL